MTLSREVRRLIDLGLRDDTLLLAIGLTLQLEEPLNENGSVSLGKAAARVHRPLFASGDYWLKDVILRDLPVHIPDHARPGAAPGHCVQPMIRRPLCARPVHGSPYASLSQGRYIPVLVGDAVAWHPYCRQHATDAPRDPAAYDAARRLPHNSGGQLRDAFPRWNLEHVYRSVSARWEPDDRPTQPARLVLVPALDDA